MGEIKHHHHPDEGTRPTVNHEYSVPYWRRTHRDWRFWIGVCFIFAAIAVYVMSVDLSVVGAYLGGPLCDVGDAIAPSVSS